jgi:hypothetical protein
MSGLGDFKILLIIAGITVTLSAVQWTLEQFMNRTKTTVDNKAHDIVGFVLGVLHWVMANRTPKI